MGVQIVPIPAASARAIWPLCEDQLVKALAYCHGAYLPEDVLDLVEKKKAQLWIAQRDDGHVVAVLVSWLNFYPRRTSVCVPFIGGSEIRTWFRKALLAIESWAVENGCDALEGGARRGWGRLAKMEEASVILWKDLKPAMQEQKAA